MTEKKKAAPSGAARPDQVEEAGTDVHGPYDTAAEALADAAPLTAAVRAADPFPRPMTEAVRAARLKVRVDHLVRALTGAGVELGEYDARIAAWLADWETETLQVLVGWIERAHAAGSAVPQDCPCACPAAGPCACRGACACTPHCPHCRPIVSTGDTDGDARCA